MNRDTAYMVAFTEQKSDLKKRKSEYELAIKDLTLADKDYKDISFKLSKIGSEIPLCVLKGDEDRLSFLNEECRKLTAAKNAIECAKGIKAFSYKCKICSDTGYYNGKICRCIKNRANTILEEDFSRDIPLKDCSFENFELKYYDGVSENGVSSKKRMTGIFKYLKEYTLNFNPNTSDNILLMGGAGLGKTHLSLAVFNELLKREYDVLYFSSFDLFTKIENEHFNLKTNTTYESVIKCDFLIIDDLGSEFVSKYGQSVFYSIINSRILSHKPTMINTNLSMREIEEKYTARVSSRLVGLYVAQKLIGRDIRQIKTFEKQIK